MEVIFLNVPNPLVRTIFFENPFSLTVEAFLAFTLILSSVYRQLMQQSEHKPAKYPYKEARFVEAGKKSYVVYYVYDENTKDLVRKRDYSPGKTGNARDRQKEANRLVKDINLLLKQGAHIKLNEKAKKPAVTKKDYTVSGAFKFLLQIKTKTARLRTVQAYQTLADRIREFLEQQGVGDVPVTYIIKNDVDNFFDWLLIEYNVMPHTHNNYLTLLKSAFNFWKEREIVSENPVSVKRLKTETGRNFAYSDSQVKELAEGMGKHDPELWLFVKFMYYCYIRPNEIRQLKIRDISQKSQTIVIHAHISKNGKQDSVIIPEPFWQALQESGVMDADEDLYIFSRDCKPGPEAKSKNTMNIRHRAMLDGLGYEKKHTLYSWKHTGVVKAFEAGVDIKAIQRQCRHHNLKETDTYLKSLGLTINDAMKYKFPTI